MGEIDVSEMNRNVIVTGASGFIGGALVRFLAGRGYKVTGFLRNPPDAAPDNVEYERFVLPDEIPEDAVAAADCVVHCAFVRHGREMPDSDRINISGTQKLLELSRRHDVKFVFLSSIAAAADAESHYGRHKHEMEGIFDLERDLILKPGLVIGDGGLVRQMAGVLGGRIVPLLDSGRQPVQTVAIDDLLAIITRGIESDIAGSYCIADRPTTMKTLYLAICEKISASPTFVPVPIALLLPAFRLGEMLHLPMPFSTENLLGLKGMREVDIGNDIEPFGVKLKDYQTALDAVHYG